MPVCAFLSPCTTNIPHTLSVSFLSAWTHPTQRHRPLSSPHPARRRRVNLRCSASNPSSTEDPSPIPPPGDSFRRTRKLLALLSSVGVAETLYLSAAKLFTSPASICRTSGCVEVLSGPYSSFLGIPLSLIGVLAYACFAFLAAWPLGAAAEEAIVSDDGAVQRMSAADVYAIRDGATRPLLLVLSSMLLVFSGYFMFLLTMVIRDTCPYCIFSAVLSTTLFVLTAFVGRAVKDAGSALQIAGGSAAFSAVAAAAVFMLSSPGGLLAPMPSEPQAPPIVTEESDTRSMAIGRKLKKRGAKMYGAYWCSHCYDQKQRLGKRAFSKVDYVECDKGGVNTQAPLCREKRIPGYPTWEIDGELFPGELQMDDLERLADGLPLSTEVPNDKK